MTIVIKSDVNDMEIKVDVPESFRSFLTHCKEEFDRDPDWLVRNLLNIGMGTASQVMTFDKKTLMLLASACNDMCYVDHHEINIVPLVAQSRREGSDSGKRR